jgi:hypothetical protein
MFSFSCWVGVSCVHIFVNTMSLISLSCSMEARVRQAAVAETESANTTDELARCGGQPLTPTLSAGIECRQRQRLSRSEEINKFCGRSSAETFARAGCDRALQLQRGDVPIGR